MKKRNMFEIVGMPIRGAGFYRIIKLNRSQGCGDAGFDRIIKMHRSQECA